MRPEGSLQGLDVLIDLHTHTTESDGTLTPDELVRAAADLRLEALGVCDHDTFAGHDQAVAPARAVGLELVCGIELSTRLRTNPHSRGRTVHLLGYFLAGPPSPEFREWLEELQRSRRDRNRRMAARLQSLGLDITLEEVQQLGKRLAGRPHFARLLVRKGYVSSLQEAFDVYLAESAKAYVQRREPDLAEGIRRIREAGGLPCVAHPVRLWKRNPDAMDGLVARMRDLGLRGIEVYHPDHSAEDSRRLLALAREYRLAVVGGSDFHGANKPEISLGTGSDGTLAVPRSVLENLRTQAGVEFTRPVSEP